MDGHIELGNCKNTPGDDVNRVTSCSGGSSTGVRSAAGAAAASTTIAPRATVAIGVLGPSFTFGAHASVSTASSFAAFASAAGATTKDR